jgi:hypothetical protein
VTAVTAVTAAMAAMAAMAVTAMTAMATAVSREPGAGSREPGAPFLSGVIVALSRKYFGPAARLAARVTPRLSWNFWPLSGYLLDSILACLRNYSPSAPLIAPSRTHAPQRTVEPSA